MITFLTISSVLANPVVFLEPTGTATLNGQALGDATVCTGLRTEDVEVVVPTGTTPWRTVLPLLVQIQKCGTHRVGLRSTDASAPVWWQLVSPGFPLVYLSTDHHARVAQGGAVADVAWNAPQDLRALKKALPHSARLNFFADATLPVATLLEAESQLRALFADHPPAPGLILSGSPNNLAGQEAALWAALREASLDDLPPDDTQPDLSLSRAFGVAQTLIANPMEVPQWTRIGSRICGTPKTPLIWGVGLVSGIKNHALARSTADNRARAEVAKLLSMRVERKGTTTKTVVAMDLTGVRVVDHWVDDTDGTVFALAQKNAPRPLVGSNLKPCPTGTRTLARWSWRPVYPSGRVGKARLPNWTGEGLQRDNENLWVTVRRPHQGPFPNAGLWLKELARAELARELLTRVDRALGSAPEGAGASCLLEIPWLEAAAGAKAESAFARPHSEQPGSWMARAVIPLAELWAATPPNCPRDTIAQLFENP